MIEQRLLRACRQQLLCPSVRLRHLAQEASRVPNDVFRALSQRRDAQMDDVDAKEQVLAKRSLLHQFFEVAMRRADETAIHGNALLAANGGPTKDYIPHHAFFQYRQSTLNAAYTRPSSVAETILGGEFGPLRIVAAI
jgi:hypothetical protein